MVISKKPLAILDSSFYIHLVKTNLINIFLEHYDLVMTKKVYEEITYFKDKSLYLPFDIRFLLKLVEDKKILIKQPKTLVNKNLPFQVSKNSGEYFSILLAKEIKAIVFIDNGRPYSFCVKNNILCSNIVEFMFYLYKHKKIKKNGLKDKLRIICDSIPKNYLKEICGFYEIKRI
ncbi:MAG: hypothetical protein PHR26_03225 [Candidatus ainarchaeum sp.]|nr:hypothetical protein [Candidatus ainarchaeum sp.]MDD3975595.1 hypothetical protein [Candidatus ainarchaeum sp.]